MSADEETLRIGYAIAKQVPDIAYRAVFSTNYGDLEFTGKDAQQIAALAGRLLQKRLKKIEGKK